jgi:DNA-binding NarL/FixJ family response regulator
MPIRVSLIEDNKGLRESLSTLLFAEHTGFQCAGIYATAEEAFEPILTNRPDVVLIDINLPGMDGIECTAQLKARLPNTEILMLTLHERPELIFDSLRAGASGYLLKSTSPSELIDAVANVHAGGTPMSMPVARRVIAHFRTQEKFVQKLTPREEELLGLLVRGYSYHEIATSLGISPSTVRAHIHSVYKKLSVKSRGQAVAWVMSQKSRPMSEQSIK